MKPYLASPAAGLLVGANDGLPNVRFAEPPVVALVGLFGILAGEQTVPVARHRGAGRYLSTELDDGPDRRPYPDQRLVPRP